MIPRYSYKQQIILINGFYKGYYAQILEWKEVKGIIYYTLRMIDEEKIQTINNIPEEFIREKKKLFGIIPI